MKAPVLERCIARALQLRAGLEKILPALHYRMKTWLNDTTSKPSMNSKAKVIVTMKSRISPCLAGNRVTTSNIGLVNPSLVSVAVRVLTWMENAGGTNEVLDATWNSSVISITQSILGRT